MTYEIFDSAVLVGAGAFRTAVTSAGLTEISLLSIKWLRNYVLESEKLHFDNLSFMPAF